MKFFGHAFCGIWNAVKSERNFRVHLAAVYYAVIFGLLLELSFSEWIPIALACGLVLGAELLNTALERLCDGLKPARSSVVKTIKDLAAGAVLVCAAAAVLVALFLFMENRPFIWWLTDPASLLASPVFWAGAGAIPLWAAFVFWFGKKK